MANDAAARGYGWDDVIENESPDFGPLPAGDYDFEVVDFERARHAGSENLPPCNKAIVHIRIQNEEGMSTIKHNLFLHSKTEGMICAFFTGIGLRKKGEPFKMNWAAVKGRRGRCKVGVKTLPPRNENEKGLDVNEIKKFYEPAEQPQTGFEPGKF